MGSEDPIENLDRVSSQMTETATRTATRTHLFEDLCVIVELVGELRGIRAEG